MTAKDQRPNNGIVRLRSAGRGGESTGQLSVPAFIARAIPGGTRFRAELVDDGILFRFIGKSSDPEISNPPEWIKELRSE